MKVIVASQTCLALPLIQQLHLRQQLAGVWLYDSCGDDSRQLAVSCEQMAVPVLTIDCSNTQAFGEHLAHVSADCVISCFLSYIFPVSVVNQLKGRLFNIHASALPVFKGPDPIFWLLRSACSETQMTLHGVSDKVDTGALVFQQTLAIHPYDTHQSLSLAIADAAPSLIQAWQVAGGLEITPCPQSGVASHAPRPSVTDLTIAWHSHTNLDVFHLARAANPVYGGAYFCYQQQRLQLLQCTPLQTESYQLAPGTIVHIGEPEGLLVVCNDGLIRMDIVATNGGVFSGLRFAERYKLQVGQQFTA